METQRLLNLWRLMTKRRFSYIKDNTSLYQITCVIDPHLAAFHITSIIFPNVDDVLNSDKLFNNLMSLLNRENYHEARIVSAQQIKQSKISQTVNIMDFYGTVHDNFPLIDKLVCAEMFSNIKIPSESRINEEIFSQFKMFGYLKGLGDPADPALILGYWLTTKPIFYIECKKKRFSRNNWKLYDNDPTKPSFQNFHLDKINDYVICMAGYVNLTQFGIAETRAGAMPFDLGLRSSLGHPEPYICPVAIPETGQGLGQRPYYSNLLDILTISDHLDEIEEDDPAAAVILLK
ncbi:uncharacterized protein LOC113654796 isoform X2 [Tachysurus fulvidraco]|uniref:uncharacterized protein LOC113654796 isoform X2 n=1 Tax=Tachysurus fulvidraco TaxID=1234273 RepID=UPI000F4DF99B|nr:uncharacterized protein LOC113654796 isoform X2 [Tachysurus fulvidraco]